ncbi:MAG: hypothetical protein ABII02_00360 [Candidatus Magasanikbacteria bacterium]
MWLRHKIHATSPTDRGKVVQKGSKMRRKVEKVAKIMLITSLIVSLSIESPFLKEIFKALTFISAGVSLGSCATQITILKEEIREIDEY